MQFRFFIHNGLIGSFYRVIRHDCARWLTEHIFQLNVDRLHAIGLLKDKLHIVGRLTNHIHRRTLTIGDTFHASHILLFHQEAHTLLAFVTDDFLGRKGRVADRQLAHVNVSTSSLYQFGEAVEVATRSVVVDRNDRILVRFSDCADHVSRTFLHLRISTLNGVQLDTAGVLTGVHGGDSTTAHTDAIVITTNHNYFLTRLRITLQGIPFVSETYTAGQHDYFVVRVFLVILRMFEGQQRTADQRLAKLVSKVGSTVGGLDQDLLRCLVEPGTRIEDLLPAACTLCAWISRHIDSGTSDRQRGLTTTQTVTDLTTRTGSRTVERLYGSREVVCLRFQGDHGVNIFDREEIRLVG